MSALTTGIVKWFDNKKDTALSVMMTQKKFLYILLRLKKRDSKLWKKNQVVEFEIIEGNRGTQAAHVKKGNVQTTDTSMHE